MLTGVRKGLGLIVKVLYALALGQVEPEIANLPCHSRGPTSEF